MAPAPPHDANGYSKPRVRLSRITLADLTPNNKKLLVVLEAASARKWNERWHKEALDAGEMVKLAFFNDVCVGSIVCKREIAAASSGAKSRIVISSLVVLKPYRRLGVASDLLQHIRKHARSAHSQPPVELVCQVPVSEVAALEFFVERHGFIKQKLLADFVPFGREGLGSHDYVELSSDAV
ncbi:hypothetical protein HDU93_005256 [Gonapodya sp. JEL0774]|nr:hypothetical protein HDU93_005256 [Gonapodya sp. JEL0774]